MARRENTGRTLPHVAVTRVLRQVGTANLDDVSAKEVTLTIHPGTGANGSRLVAFIQDPRSGHVLAVAEQEL